MIFKTKSVRHIPSAYAFLSNIPVNGEFSFLIKSETDSEKKEFVDNYQEKILLHCLGDKVFGDFSQKDANYSEMIDHALRVGMSNQAIIEEILKYYEENYIVLAQENINGGSIYLIIEVGNKKEKFI